ncbi:hypothetical protein GQ43DRAFT_121804 [Delitschia confertaspora ATCC 74209]|uniref:Uncharacterized protein n=1 Tax=Delitschia confertaspora ATCC 74209 TaxID=1513339 RepID=A0A9P4MZ00_9PLEO|nr:hypothetical protein GQ43DRAFT_121804 [Delitschia confertaspora ATCC 74209]
MTCAVRLHAPGSLNSSQQNGLGRQRQIPCRLCRPPKNAMQKKEWLCTFYFVATTGVVWLGFALCRCWSWYFDISSAQLGRK